jgi:hypothetical protein
MASEIIFAVQPRSRSSAWVIIGSACPGPALFPRTPCAQISRQYRAEPTMLLRNYLPQWRSRDQRRAPLQPS